MTRQQQQQQRPPLIAGRTAAVTGGVGQPSSSSPSLPAASSLLSIATNQRRPRRQRYNTVAISDRDEDEEDEYNRTNGNTNEDNEVDDDDIEEAITDSTSAMNRSSNMNTQQHHQQRSNRRQQQQQQYAAVPSSSSSKVILMEVTILDFTHKRWPIQITTDNITTTNTTTTTTTTVSPTVYDLKYVGSTVHNIPMQQQRLIYQGKLLNDDTLSLSSLGIQHKGSIVHLFPKPRVVIVGGSNNDSSDTTTGSTNSSTTGTTTTNSTTSNGNDNSTATHNHTDSTGSSANNINNNNGAHIPVIVMDQSEVDRRSEILVLGHVDYVEAVSNVKLFSLMLLIISTIELLHLLSLYITPPSNNNSSTQSGSSNHQYGSNSNYGSDSNNIPSLAEHDDFFKPDDDSMIPSNGSSFANKTSDIISSITGGTIDPIDRILGQWTPIKYIDLIISIMGIYVAILGMRASNENCIRTARYYLIGTTITAIGWLLYNYIVSYEIDVEVDAHPERYYNMGDPDDSYGSTATTSDDAIAESFSNNHTDVNPYSQAFTAMILPGIVWGLCIFRAWQFQHVLYDAEMEAAQRTNSSTSSDGIMMTESPSHNNHNNSGGDVELSTFESRHSTRNTNDDDNNNNSNSASQQSAPVAGTMA